MVTTRKNGVYLERNVRHELCGGAHVVRVGDHAALQVAHGPRLGGGNGPYVASHVVLGLQGAEQRQQWGLHGAMNITVH